ncbi:MAG: tetratricopeptide repeat protein, partial [Acidobacteria bacterium]|nr:tetratricopeptide repeat protein [Acidobacteriota bacterium]
NLSGGEESDWLSTALQEMLSMELAASQRIRVVPGDIVARARMELGLHDMSTLSARDLDRITRNLGADLIILGSYFMEEEDSDPEIRFDVRVHRRGSEVVVSPVIETGPRSELLRLVSHAGEKLRAELGYHSADTDTTTALLASYPVDADATMAYARGLEALRDGDPIGARDSLERSVMIEPGNPLAHSALSSAWSSLGYENRARAAAKRAMELSKGLPREERLLIQGRYYESASAWSEASETYAHLWELAPDNIEYGLALARSQANGGNPAAFATLRRIESISSSPDPRIPLAEASAAEALGEFVIERAAARTAAEQSREMGAWVLLARAKLAEWWAERNLGNLEAATAASSEAWEIATRVGERSLVAQALNAIATTKRQMGQTAEARQLDLESLQVFREIGDKRREAWALNNLGRAAYEEGDFAEAMRYFDSSIEIAREIDDQAGVSRGLGNQGNVLRDLGRLRESEVLFREMLDLAVKSNDRRSIPWSRANLAGTLSGLGRLDDARALLYEARKGFESTGERRGEGWTLIRLGEIARFSGEPQKAEALLRDALDLFREIEDQQGKSWAAMTLAETLLVQGKQDEAGALLADALTRQQSVGDRYGEAMNHVIASRAALSRAETGRAKELAARAASMFGALEASSRRAEALTVLSRARLAAGELAAARAASESARSAMEDRSDQRLSIMLQITAHEIEARSGRMEAAALEGLRRAKSDALGSGYRDLAAEAEEVIQSLS